MTHTPFGSLRSQPLTVVADDGVPLHVEVDELDAAVTGGKGARARRRHAELTVVFVHGYALDAGLVALPARGLPRPGAHGLLRPALPRPLRPVDRGQRQHRAARPRPPARARRGRARGPGRAGRPLDGRHDHRRAGRGAPRAVRRPRSSASAWSARPRAASTPSGWCCPLLPSTVGGQFASRLVAALARGHRTVDRFRQVRALGGARRDRRAGVRRRRTGAVRRVRRRDALGDAVRRGRRLLPDVRHAREVRDRARDEQRARPRSSAAPATSSRRSTTAASCTR